jgi:lysophospholipase L1-like esterase
LSAEIALRLVAAMHVQSVYKTFAGSLDKAPGVYRIVCFGESTAAGPGRAEEAARLSFAGQLERLFREKRPGARVEVLNRGVSGISVHEMHRHFRRNLELLDPDLVVLQAGNNTYPTPSTWFGSPFLESTVGRLRVIQTTKLAAELGLAWLRGDIDHATHFGRTYVFLHSQRALSHDRLVHDATRLTLRMVDQCRERGVPVVLCGYFRDHGNQVLGDVAAARSVPLCDAAAIYQDYRGRGRLPEIVTQDGFHPTPLGHRLIAEVLFQTVLASYPPPDPPRSFEP